MPSVSIIVPVYNTEKYLEKTVSLLCSQTIKDIEIILVDDGSTDNSPVLCDKIAASDKRVKVIHQPNSGISKARNAGLSAAIGDYIGFCDSDDFPDLDMYETLYKNAVENNCDISAVRSRIISDNGRTMLDAQTGEFELFTSEQKSNCIKAFLNEKFQSGVYTKLFRRELCKKLAFNNKIKINEDKLFLFEGLMHADTVCLHNITKYSYVRRNNSSSCTAFCDKFFDSLIVNNYIKDTVESEFPELSDEARANVAQAQLYILHHMCKSGKRKAYISRYNEIAKELRSLDRSFCKHTFRKNDYIKWSALKLGNVPFIILLRLFGK